MIRNLWQHMFLRFLKKYHLTQYFKGSHSPQALHHSSDAKQVEVDLSQNLKAATQISSTELLTQLYVVNASNESPFISNVMAGSNEL